MGTFFTSFKYIIEVYLIFFPLRYVPKALVYSLLWSFAGDGKLKARSELGDFIRDNTTIPLPAGSLPIVDYEVSELGQPIPDLWCEFEHFRN